MNELRKNQQRRNNNNLLLLLLFLSFPVLLMSQNQVLSAKIMFYNVENLFDNLDDPETNDEEFLPRGERHWTKDRLELKYKRIYQVIAAVGFPAIVGVSEVENLYVLEHLLSSTPLAKMEYKIIHKESPDQRGIDVAMLYRDSQFNPIWYDAIPVINPSDPNFKTRDILYVKGVLFSDTLHLFVNHWPSKYGGAVDTKPLRNLAAKTLRCYADSILITNPNANVLMMGDFNDGPQDESVEEVLGAQNPVNISENLHWINLAYPLALQGKGSNKYQSKWDLIDQMIVSKAMLSVNASISAQSPDFHIFDAPFLLIEDENYLGMKLFRTYNGFKYMGGFSDHLPVYVELKSIAR